MNDLERVKEIEEAFGFPLRRVELAELFTAHAFLTSIYYYSLADMQDPRFYFKGARNYSVDEEGYVTGLALDYSPLLLLPMLGATPRYDTVTLARLKTDSRLGKG